MMECPLGPTQLPLATQDPTHVETSKYGYAREELNLRLYFI